MNHKRFFITIAFMLFFISSCQSENPNLEYMADVDLPVQVMNQDLHIILESADNSFEMGDEVGLTVYNSSKHPVSIPPDLNLHIYKKMEGQWVSVFEGLEDVEGNYWILANGSEDRWQEIFSVLPEVYSQYPVEVRFVIVGNFVKRNGDLGKEVGAYADTTLYPK